MGIGRQIVHRIAVGHLDITGDDFGTIFANAISGEGFVLRNPDAHYTPGRTADLLKLK